MIQYGATLNCRIGTKIHAKTDPPVNPDKNIPTKPDRNPDPTKIRPGVNEPEKADPTRINNPSIEQPSK
ncbi:MAG: hypothetical protein SGJ15_10215 [Bacteroidota bacterium]|nr:hypothetical protein [Bacteroidota bacterium]